MQSADISLFSGKGSRKHFAGSIERGRKMNYNHFKRIYTEVRIEAKDRKGDFNENRSSRDSGAQGNSLEKWG